MTSGAEGSKKAGIIRSARSKIRVEGRDVRAPGRNMDIIRRGTRRNKRLSSNDAYEINESPDYVNEVMLLTEIFFILRMGLLTDINCYTLMGMRDIFDSILFHFSLRC